MLIKLLKIFYEIDKFNGVLKEYDENGEVTKSYENKFTTSLSTEGVFNISLNKKNGFKIKVNNVDVSKDGQFINFDLPEHYLGNVAIACLARSSTEDECYIDEFKVIENAYYRPVTKSVTHDFSEDYFGNPGFEDIIIIHNSEAEQDDIYVDKEAGKLVFNGASDYSKFGSAHQYDDFILDFKLTSIYADPTVEKSTTITQRGNWIGFDISRESVTEKRFGTYLTLGTSINPEPTATKAGIGIAAVVGISGLAVGFFFLLKLFVI